MRWASCATLAWSVVQSATSPTLPILPQSDADSKKFYLYDEGHVACRGANASFSVDTAVKGASMEMLNITFHTGPLGILLKFHRNTTYVGRVVAGSAAERAGVERGDELMSIQAEDISAQNLESVLTAIRSASRPLTIRFRRTLTTNGEPIAPPWRCGCWSTYFDALVTALRSHPARTLDADRADFFIPTVDTAAETNFPAYGFQEENMISGEFVQCHRRMRRRVVESPPDVSLKFLTNASRNGVKHVFFDFDPADNSLIDFARSRSDVVIAKNSACSTLDAVGRQNGLKSYFFDGRVVSFPPPPVKKLPASITTSLDGVLPDSLKPYLCSFRGRESTDDRFRKKLKKLNEIGGSRWHIVISDEPSGDYMSEMMSSEFCLVPRGDCLFSYRLLEALAASCIPVVLSDGYVIPFSEEVDWSEFSLVVQEKEYLALPNILKDITEAQRAAMRSKGAAAWMQWFHDIGTQLDALLLILSKY
jgi:hypothetical protein